MNDQTIQLVECPRDSMQGWPKWIPTEKKIEYIQSFLAVGFDTIDAGSFVNPKLVPQMADSADVFKSLELKSTHTKLLAIIGNVQGAMQAMKFEHLYYLGYPFSISPTFLKRNLNRNIEAALQDIAAINRLCTEHGKELVLYFSMAFGNPYGDPYEPNEIIKWLDHFQKEGITKFTLADTTAEANADLLQKIYNITKPYSSEIQLGLHLHADKQQMASLAQKAYEVGFKRFETSLHGIGGCPFAKNELTGNLDTLVLLDLLKEKHEWLSINEQALAKSIALSKQLFSDGI